jgi:hypothetical protein
MEPHITIETPPGHPKSQLRLMQANEWIRRQTVKDRYFDPAIFAGPAWALFLDLYAARIAMRDMSVAAACASAKVPTVTALRWIDALIEAGFLHRRDGNVDMRRAVLGLTDTALETMDRMLDDIETG